jgi:four helix bundle protein
MELSLETYRLTRRFPRSELYGLSSQAQRAAVSVPANIAEGHGRFYRGDFQRHVAIARGSLMEPDTHLELARQLGYASERDLSRASAMIDKLGRMLTNLATKLARSPMHDAR